MNHTIQHAYTAALRMLTARRGLPWRIDQTTTLRIDARCRWIRHSGYEVEVVQYLGDRIRPGAVCIDVGAHVGFYVMRMALWTAPRGRVVAFEPNPTAREVLQANVALNRLSARVTVEPMAVGAAERIGHLYHAGETTGLSRLDAPNQGSASAPVAVPVITLDQYCAVHRLAPDFILIDTEGAELSVLQGAAALLAETAAQVVVEMHPALWDPAHTTPDSFRAFLETCGRTAIPITRTGDPFADHGGTIALDRRGSLPLI